GRRRVRLAVVHPAAHVGVEREILHLEQDLPGTGRRDRGFLQAEVGESGLPLRAGGKHDLAGPGCGHVSCLHEVCPASRFRPPPHRRADRRHQALRNSLACLKNNSACWYWAPWLESGYMMSWASGRCSARMKALIGRTTMSFVPCTTRVGCLMFCRVAYRLL